MASKGGQEGNNNAGRGKLWNDALRKAIVQDDALRLRKAAEQLLDKAAEGEAWAIRELADRLDGKAFQSVELSGGIEIKKRAEELTDDELASIAAGSSGRTS